MTSVTERLRELLDERGVEYETFSGAFATKTCWPCANGLMAIFVEYDEGTTRFEMSRWHVAPEQAIAATLESDSEYERKMDALLCRLTNGKFSKTRTYDLDFMESAVREEFETECVSEPGTCKLTQASWDDGICTWGCICSACDAHLEHETGIGYNFCPICGRKAVVE